MGPHGQVFLLLLLFSTASLISHAAKAPFDTESQYEVEPFTLKKINKLEEGFKTAFIVLLNVMDIALQATTPLMTLLPAYGKEIGACVNLARLPFAIFLEHKKEQQVLMTVLSQFEALNKKIDNYRVEHKWDTWAAGTFSKPELKIETAWISYKTMLHAMRLSQTENERDSHRDRFIQSYPKYAGATKELHIMLTAGGATFISNLGDLLAQHLWCHQRDLREYSLFINKLIYKGNMMNQFYYKMTGPDSKAYTYENAKIAYNASYVMFKVHQQCIYRGMYYVQKDVELLIDKAKNPQELSQLALQIRQFLDKTYDSYNWMVVVFIAKKSGHRLVESRNRHTLNNFYQVNKDKVSVAVARQVKGTHTKAVLVQKVIQKCVPSNTVCYKVAKTLSKCRLTVDLGGGIRLPISQAYTAVHAYTRKPEDSTTDEEPLEDVHADPEAASRMLQVYSAKCKKSRFEKKGQFVVLIKSDEELMNKDPCDMLRCSNRERGSCVRVPGVFLAMCECKYPYYGRHCEKSLDAYKTELELESQGIIIVRQKTSRSNNDYRGFKKSLQFIAPDHQNILF